VSAIAPVNQTWVVCNMHRMLQPVECGDNSSRNADAVHAVLLFNLNLHDVVGPPQTIRKRHPRILGSMKPPTFRKGRG